MSEPYNEAYLFPFRNVLGRFETELPPEEIIARIKQVEIAVGRMPYDKKNGRITIDIDLIKYNEEILRPEDYERSYVQELLTESFN